MIKKMAKRDKDGLLVYKRNNNTKCKYSLPSNLIYLTKFISKFDKTYLPLLFVMTLTSAAIEPLWSFFNRDIVNFVLNEGERARLLFSMSFMILAIMSAEFLNVTASNRVELYKWRKIDFKFRMKLYQKKFDTDYENLEAPITKTKFEKARNSLNTFGQLYYTIPSLIMNVFTVLGWSAILSTLSPWLILIILLPTVAYYNAVRYKIKWYTSRENEFTEIDRRIRYARNTSRNFQNAKDIRLYNMENKFLNIMRDYAEKRLWWYKKQGKMEFKNGFIMIAIVALRDLASYGFIIFSVMKGNMTPGDFMLYFSSVGAIADSFYSLLDDYGNVKWTSFYISFYREFEEIPDKTNRGKGKPLPEEKFDIRFENVSYTYAGADSPTLKNLSFTIKTGEKIAVVGSNGAGKTTLVKLICGIYQATEGEIYINDVPINEYNRDELYTITAAVFQDIHIMPATIAENIAMTDEYDRKVLNYALSHSGIGEKVNKLPDGMETLLVRSVYDKAIDLSGGETQKLALARALYKQKKFGSKILLLDEPTAALDPLAEQSMYLEYAKFSSGKTSVFISHRLASTQFCDRIFYLSGGEITETGTHKELLEKGGEYKRIFEIQSQYYKDEEIKEALREKAL